MKRVFLIVLDSFGIGEMPDAAAYGDINVNTLRSVSRSPYFPLALRTLFSYGTYEKHGFV